MAAPAPPPRAAPLAALTPPGPAVAVELLADTPGVPGPDALAAPGDALEPRGDVESLLRGHGTIAAGPTGLAATVAGVVGRVDRLVGVAAAGGRYGTDVGDVVVGRVSGLAGKRWRVDLGGRQDAALPLSAVRLPGGAARRRTAEDEASMRALLSEGDPIAAEVHALHGDGCALLQARSRRHGKLGDGVLVSVPPRCASRQRTQAATCPGARVRIVLGVNGWVWVSPDRGGQEGDTAAGGLGGDDDDAPPPPTPLPPTPAQRLDVAAAVGALRALGALGLPVTPESVDAAVAAAAAAGVRPPDMGEVAFLRVVAQGERERRMGMQEDD
jgi:exosome complex component RRP4